MIRKEESEEKHKDIFIINILQGSSLGLTPVRIKNAGYSVWAGYGHAPVLILASIDARLPSL